MSRVTPPKTEEGAARPHAGPGTLPQPTGDLKRAKSDLGRFGYCLLESTSDPSPNSRAGLRRQRNSGVVGGIRIRLLLSPSRQARQGTTEIYDRRSLCELGVLARSSTRRRPFTACGYATPACAPLPPGYHVNDVVVE